MDKLNPLEEPFRENLFSKILLGLQKQKMYFIIVQTLLKNSSDLYKIRFLKCSLAG